MHLVSVTLFIEADELIRNFNVVYVSFSWLWSFHGVQVWIFKLTRINTLSMFLCQLMNFHISKSVAMVVAWASYGPFH